MGPKYRGKSVLTGMQAGQAMQRAFPRISPERGLDEVIRQMVRTREDAVLVADSRGEGLGVVTKTDVMAAFYGGLPLETRAEDIMAGPVETCHGQEGLDQVLDRMKGRRIHQIFVAAQDSRRIEGKLSYEDVAGLIYRICRACRQGRRHSPDKSGLPRLLVNEVMTGQVQTCRVDHSLCEVMDLLSADKIRAVPVADDSGRALGVISKTDLILAYSRARTAEDPAGEVMTAPVVTGRPDESLAEALKLMLMTDIQHLFVTGPSGKVTGVVSLSDAARFRSGTCRACSPSRNF